MDGKHATSTFGSMKLLAVISWLTRASGPAAGDSLGLRCDPDGPAAVLRELGGRVRSCELQQP